MYVIPTRTEGGQSEILATPLLLRLPISDHIISNDVTITIVGSHASLPSYLSDNVWVSPYWPTGLPGASNQPLGPMNWIIWHSGDQSAKQPRSACRPRCQLPQQHRIVYCLSPVSTAKSIQGAVRFPGAQHLIPGKRALISSDFVVSLFQKPRQTLM